MIFFANASGGFANVLPESVNQGSNLANKIVFIAPFSRTNTVTVAFTLPNGADTNQRVLSLATEPLTGVYEGLNVWVTELDEYITQYSGEVTAQFFVRNGNERIATLSEVFTINKGVPIDSGVISDTETLEELLDIVTAINEEFQVLNEYTTKIDNIEETVTELESEIDRVEGKIIDVKGNESSDAYTKLESIKIGDKEYYIPDEVMRGMDPPTTSTKASVGKLYICVANGTLYQCNTIQDGQYKWSRILDQLDIVPNPANTFITLPLEYIRINGTDYRITTEDIIKGEGDPPSLGKIGQIYIDTTSGVAYQYIQKNGETNEWQLIVNSTGLQGQLKLLKDYVDLRANGSNKAVSYINYSSMISSLNVLSRDKHDVGQNIMIVTLNVPDLWISDITTTSVPYTYVSDDDFVSELETNGFVQVGYFKLSALETQKVDLEDYATKEELDKKVDEWDGVAGGNYTLRARSKVTEGSTTTYLHISTIPKKYSVPYFLDKDSGTSIPSGANGYIVCLDPVNPYHTANKKYVDDNFVDKQATPSRLSLYAINTNGETTLVGTSPNATNNGMVPVYNSNGNISVLTPTGDKHATNKKYVDDAIANAGGGGGSKIYKHTFEGVFASDDGAVNGSFYGYVYSTKSTPIVTVNGISQEDSETVIGGNEKSVALFVDGMYDVMFDARPHSGYIWSFPEEIREFNCVVTEV